MEWMRHHTCSEYMVVFHVQVHSRTAWLTESNRHKHLNLWTFTPSGTWFWAIGQAALGVSKDCGVVIFWVKQSSIIFQQITPKKTANSTVWVYNNLNWEFNNCCPFKEKHELADKVNILAEQALTEWNALNVVLIDTMIMWHHCNVQ